MTAQTAETPHASASLPAMALGALGVVFGDIGTSPLYTFKTVLDYTGPHPKRVPREDGKRLPRWIVAIFAAMGRNAARISDSLQLPHNHVVEIGREIAI